MGLCICIYEGGKKLFYKYYNIHFGRFGFYAHVMYYVCNVHIYVYKIVVVLLLSTQGDGSSEFM